MSSDRLVVVGIAGPAGSGKDTCAAALSLHRGCTRIALADGIREALASLSGPTGQLFKELTPDHNYRRAMQVLGTESREAAGAPGLWVHLLLAKIHYASVLAPVPRHRFAIPDVRYRHEAMMLSHWVRRRGGAFGVLRLSRGAVGPIPEADHSSEARFGEVPADRDYANDLTVPALASAAVTFFDDLASGHLRGEAY